jgi:signal transduction histidine kinase
MQLDLASDCFQPAPRVAEQALQTARNMSRRSMIEARQSVWDLRCQLLENGDLTSAISQIVEPLISRKQAKVNVSISGKPVHLPREIEMNLLRIGQEAVANAMKHGRAKNVDIELAYGGNSVSLSVGDDGVGFAAAEPAPSGHFGLLDMRERAQSIGSQLKIASEPGRGTRVVVEVSMPSEVVYAKLKTHSHFGG